MNRRWRNLILPRRRRPDPPWTVTVSTPPPFIPSARGPAGWRPRWNPLPRRGQFQNVPPPPVVQASVWIPGYLNPLRRRLVRTSHGTFGALPAGTPGGSGIVGRAATRLRGLSGRRGRFLTVPPAQIGPGLGPLVVPFVQPATRRPRAASRHGQFFSVPSTVGPAVGPFIEPAGPRPRYPATRRGRFIPLPVTQFTAPGPIEPGSRPRLQVPRRGRFHSVPPASVAPAGPGPLVPAPTEPAGPRARTYLPRRGTFHRVPLAGVAPAVPIVPLPFLSSGSIRVLTTRRGRIWAVPPVISIVPGQINPSRLPRPMLRTRRTVQWTPIAQPAVAPQWIPDQAHPSRTMRGNLTRRGRYWVLTSAPVITPPTSFVDRLRSRRPAIPPTRRGHRLDNWSTARPGFVCQDFATSVTITAYAATLSTTAYSAAVSVDAYSATLTIDAYGGTATNCGR